MRVTGSIRTWRGFTIECSDEELFTGDEAMVPGPEDLLRESNELLEAEFAKLGITSIELLIVPIPAADIMLSPKAIVDFNGTTVPP